MILKNELYVIDKYNFLSTIDLKWEQLILKPAVVPPGIWQCWHSKVVFIFEGYGAEIDSLLTPGEMLKRIDLYFDARLKIIEATQSWELNLDVDLLKMRKIRGKYWVQNGITQVQSQLLPYSVAVVRAYGPSIHFALVALLSNYLCLEPPHPENSAAMIRKLLQYFQIETGAVPRDYLFRMASATQLGSGDYIAEIKEVDGIFQAAIRRRE